MNRRGGGGGHELDHLAVEAIGGAVIAEGDAGFAGGERIAAEQVPLFAVRQLIDP